MRREFTELHLGAAVRIVLHAPDDVAAREAARAAFARIAALEDIMSDYRPASEVRRLVVEARGRPVALSAELCAVLGMALEMARASGGAYDPTVGPFVDLWRKARRTGQLPSSAALADARAKVGWRHVQLDSTACTATITAPGVQFDLGGIAKGFILDEALIVLAERGVASALIEAGGDIVAGAPPPGSPGWRIAVPHSDSAFVARAAALSHAAISTSGGTEQFIEIDGKRYSHVIDPRTGLGSTTGALATVIADSGIIADALATALTIMDAEEAAVLLRAYPAVIALRLESRKRSERSTVHSSPFAVGVHVGRTRCPDHCSLSTVDCSLRFFAHSPLCRDSLELHRAVPLTLARRSHAGRCTATDLP